jgi:hypothetical protein
MKKIILINLLIYTSFALISCGTTMPLKSKLKPSEINNLSIHVLPSVMGSISKANKAEYNQMYSDSLKSLTVEEIPKFIPSHINKSLFIFDNDNEKKQIENEIENLINFIEKRRNIKNLQVSDKIISYFESKKIEFVLFSHSSGFTREKGNYAKQIGKSLGVGILTLGMVVPISYKANLSNNIFIVDIKSKNVAFYRRSSMELEPLKIKNIDKELNRLLTSYFNPLNQN